MIVWVLGDNPFRAFYESLGGKYISDRYIVIGGASLLDIAEREYIQKGIENLFPDSLIKSVIEYRDAFFDIIPPSKIEGEIQGKTKYKINKNQKRNLCEWICQNSTKDDFKDFEKVSKIIEETVLK